MRYVYTCVYAYVYVYIYAYACIYVYMYVFLYVYIHTCIYMLRGGIRSWTNCFFFPTYFSFEKEKQKMWTQTTDNLKSKIIDLST